MPGRIQRRKPLGYCVAGRDALWGFSANQQSLKKLRVPASASRCDGRPHSFVDARGGAMQFRVVDMGPGGRPVGME